MIDTTDDVEATAARELPAPEPVPVPGWPTWKRRTIIGATLFVALALLIWGVTTAGSSTDNEIVRGAIVGLTPPEGGQALRQTAVGANLAAGYDGRLTVNGIDIPEEQMVGARDPSTLSAADLAKYGVRANNRNSVFFKPGPGKVIEKFDPGSVTITLRYFKDRQASTTTNSVTWTIRVL